MNRRTFLTRSALLAAGGFVLASSPALAEVALKAEDLRFDSEMYKRFKTPDSHYRPFVRWWWNGDQVEAKELVRELRLLKAAGIGGVEINPIEMPKTAVNLGKKTLQWLSPEWIDMLQVTFDEAKKLDMTCDLIVGSGWPFGAESLEGDERAMAVYIDVEKITGPQEYSITLDEIIKKVDPDVSVKNPSRSFDLLDLKLVPDPMDNMGQVIDLSSQIGQKEFKVTVPSGKHVFYALVQVHAFASVINGAPGAAGPILNHLDKVAVKKYLDHMSDTIEAQLGPLSKHLRAFFTDSMELEGLNWNTDFAAEFKKRNGYDILPYLPFIMFKVGRLGGVTDANYGAQKTPAFKEMLSRIRYDFEKTKADMLKERFTDTFTGWCKEKGIKSRAQAYGRGFHGLETSMGYDIPEGESWTSNYLHHRLGEEMGYEDYRRGRGYTMINKFVASAAHLTGKRVVSAEEMTNTYDVFNAQLEFLKLGSDMSIISGITHSVFHGFNYSPPEVPFPGWIQYGSYYNENNNWWPYFKYFNDYKARLSSVLQNADMYTDIALLPGTGDLWSDHGVQTDPFPEVANTPYFTFIWEAMNKNGNGTDYTSEPIIRASKVENGRLCYGPKKYKELFLVGIERMEPATLKKIYEFVKGGGRVFCVEKYPSKSLGFKDYAKRDKEVATWIEKLKTFNDRFILLDLPSDYDFIPWYTGVQKKYNLTPYVVIDQPDPYVMQTRYVTDNGTQVVFIMNANRYHSHATKLTFSPELLDGRYPWLWDMTTGERYRLTLDSDNSLMVNLSRADSRMIVFDKESEGPAYRELPTQGTDALQVGNWEVELRHGRDGSVKSITMPKLVDLKETVFVSFMGTAIYRTKVKVSDPSKAILNLGSVCGGVSMLKVNGKECGVKWYGDRIYDLSGILIQGENEIEVSVVTNMGNYMKTLTDNPNAMKWVTKANKNQRIQSMGLVGPVQLY